MIGRGGGAGRGLEAQVQGAKQMTTDGKWTPGCQGAEKDESTRGWSGKDLSKN